MKAPQQKWINFALKKQQKCSWRWNEWHNKRKFDIGFSKVWCMVLSMMMIATATTKQCNNCAAMVLSSFFFHFPTYDSFILCVLQCTFSTFVSGNTAQQSIQSTSNRKSKITHAIHLANGPHIHIQYMHTVHSALTQFATINIIIIIFIVMYIFMCVILLFITPWLSLHLFLFHSCCTIISVQTNYEIESQFRKMCPKRSITFEKPQCIGGLLQHIGRRT